jgi:peptidoglycan/LPS O-acetylase OafA/YrhL
MPVYYLCIFLLVLLGVPAISNHWGWHVLYLSNFHEALGGPPTVFWTLAVEEQFYLLWPLLIILTPRAYHVTLALLLISSTIIIKIFWLLMGLPLNWMELMLVGNFETLGAGGLLAIVSHGKKPNDFSWATPQRQRLYALIALIAIAIAIFLWAYFGRRSLTRYFFNDFLLAIAFSWLIFRAVQGFKGIIGFVLSCKPITYMGRISYGIYIVHNFLPGIVRSPLVENLTGPLALWQMGLLVVFGSIAIPAFFWEIMEKHINSLKKYFPMKVQSAPISTSAKYQNS